MQHICRQDILFLQMPIRIFLKGLITTMIKKHCFLPWILTGCLILGGLTGCSGSKHNSADHSGSTPQSTQTTQSMTDHNENEDSNLGAWGRAMGAVLISINDGNPYYFGGYETTEDNKKAARNILRSSWNISSRKDLLRQVRFLQKTGSRKDYKREARELKALSAKERKKALKQVSGTLKTHYDNLQYISDNWGNKGLLAWDLCRISHLVQWGYIADYVNLDEAQALLEPAASRLQKSFTNWNDVITNWLDGYAYASSIAIRSVQTTDYNNRQEIYQKLLSEQKDVDPLFDNKLFQEDIIPLGTVSYDSLMKEIKTTHKIKKKQNKTSPKKDVSREG